MKVIKRLEMINWSDIQVNAALALIPAEDIISTHFSVYGHQEASDTWTVVFYRTEVSA